MSEIQSGDAVNLDRVDLDDRAKFWCRRGVPILDEHVYIQPPHEDGTPRPDIDFDAERLRLLVSKANERADEGEYAVLRFGHIKYTTHLPESLQPKPIGFAKNFRLAPWVDGDGRVVKSGLFIVCDFYYYADISKEEVESYPHRSIEMDHRRNVIDGVSLLRRPPERPLGLLIYARDGGGESIVFDDPTVPKKRGGMVALKIPVGVASGLAVEGGEPAEALHCTLACLDGELDDGTRDVVKATCAAIASRHRPLFGGVGGVGRFSATASSDGKDVFYASVDIPGLSELRNDIVSALIANGVPVKRNHGFTPHVTLKYLPPSDASPIGRLDPKPVEFAEVGFADDDGDYSFFPLKTDEPEPTEEPEAMPLSPEDVTAIVTAIVDALKPPASADANGKPEDVIQNEASAPSENNTYVPSTVDADDSKKKKDEDEDNDSDRINMSRNNAPNDTSAFDAKLAALETKLVGRINTLEAENTSLKSQLEAERDANSEVRIQYNRRNVDAELDRAASEGVRFDREKEAARLLSLGEAERAEHLASMRINYARVPMDGMIPISNAKTSGDRSISNDERRRLENYCTRSGKGYVEAKGLYLAGSITI